MRPLDRIDREILRALQNEALRTFALDHGTSREVVVHVETCLIFEHHRTWVTPDFEPR